MISTLHLGNHPSISSLEAIDKISLSYLSEPCQPFVPHILNKFQMK